MAFGAVTILMDTLHQHFLLPTPRFPLRNTRKVKLLYKNLSSLQTTLQQDFEIGENDEAIKALEAQIRDVSVELRFQIEHQLRLFYLGKSMKLRLHSAQKLLPILNLAKQDIESMDFGSMLDILWNHFVLPVWRMPPYIKKRVKSFWILHELLYYERGRKDKQDRDDEQESNDEQESDDNEQESDDEQENEDEQKIKDEWENEEETEDDSETELSGVISIATMRFMHMLCEQESKNEKVEDEWETEEEQNSDDKQESEDEQEINDKQRRWYMLCEEAESIITQELRAPSYLNKYMKQRIQARQRIRQLFMQGIKLTSCINKKLLKLKFAYHQPINSENNNIASLRGLGCNNFRKLEVEVESIDEPLNIWGLPQLKNLTFHGGITLVPPRSVHHNLETIKILNYWSCTKELFVKVPNLKTLGVGEGHTINPTSNWFESLAYLYKLEELKVRGKLLHPMFRTIHLMGTLGVENFLPNLKTLKLFNTKLHWKDMFVVGMLSKLEVLSILENAVVGRKWEPKDGGFHQLKFLGISSCDLQCWKVTSGHFPVLECLVLGDMRLLKRIPSGFADIVTLKSIKLYSCLDSTISSAKRIQEEQREYGNNMFAVDILRANDFHDQLWV
nr:uncharacterized protein LOC109176855 isoform X1 [Ipomoea trifida]